MKKKTSALLTAGLIALIASVGSAPAQTPKKGGILTFAVAGGEPANYDCHASPSYTLLHPVSAHYSTLLTFDGNHENIKIAGDLAKEWEVAKDGLSYTFKLRDGVKFHDGSPLTSEDVKATYERIIEPPAGVISLRKGLYQDIQAIETPDAMTVVFKLARPNSSMLTLFASPFNCIYRAAKLKEDPKFPEKTVLGTGAFEFVEYKKGEAWTAKRFDGYFQKDRPYLDGYKAFFVSGNAVPPGIIGGQFDAEWRGRTPKERDQILDAMKDKAVALEGPWVTNLMFTFNTQKKPFDDVRVRQALTMAIDRWGSAPKLARISLLKYVSGIFRPGYEYGLSQGALEKLPGYGPDINKSREEAKKLLAAAGVSNLKVRFINRIAEPHTTAAIFILDQWRSIGVQAEHVPLETKQFFEAQKEGNFDVVMDFISDFADDPSAQMDKLLTAEKSAQSLSGHKDKLLDDLYEKQKRALDPAERKKLVNQFETHALTQVYSAPIFWWQRIVVMNKKIKGWDLQPSHFTGNSYVNVWLDQ